MKPHALLAAALLVAAASYLAGRLLALPPAAADPPPPPPTARDVRAEVRRIVAEEVARLDGRQEVEAYLDRLVERARRGRAVTALASDPGRARWNQASVTSAQLAAEYGFTDVDGSRPDVWRYMEAVDAGDQNADPNDYR